MFLLAPWVVPSTPAPSLIDPDGLAYEEVLKKLRKRQKALFEEEARKKTQLRKDLEYAAYGPPLEYPEFKIELPPKQPDYSDLAKLLVSHKIDDEEEAIQLLLGVY